MKRICRTFLLLLLPGLLSAQVAPGVYRAAEPLDGGKRNYLLLVADSYVVHTIYDSGPAHFVSTMGGYYTVGEDSLKVDLEFNSAFGETGERTHRVSVSYSDGSLILNGNTARPYTREPAMQQPLDGQRRGDGQPRKTLKFLKDGYFQWIAYNTDTMEFFGCGGGRYAAENGTYIEAIQFFSRDDSRVGAELDFQFERKGSDWHHTGKNSRGEPLYEIWSLRD